MIAPSAATVLGQKMSDDGHFRIRPGELITNQQGQTTADEKEKQRGPEVLDADHLVVVGPQILPEETLLRMVGVFRGNDAVQR